jgi:alpha-L-fucosidase
MKANLRKIQVEFLIYFLFVLLFLVSCRRVEIEGGQVILPPDARMTEIIKAAASVTPSSRQIAWQELEFTAFIHFGPNTFTGRQWGTGQEDPAVFAPTELDTDQWVKVCQDAGMKLIIITAKHHDGFCLWPSRYTEHSVKNSPWRAGEGDVVAELADSCRKYNLKLGIYLSPWDRHEATYGDSPLYNRFFINQLKELMTNYGEITEVWFDGACGEGPNGKRQIYDWEAYYRVVRKLQPQAVIAICGLDVRWCGNEAGKTRPSEWSVIPMLPDKIRRLDADPAFARMQEDGYLEDLGSREKLEKAQVLAWFPAEVNTSIRPSWFYDPREDDQVKSLEELLRIYFGSVGGNSVFLLNIPPDKRGAIHENDVLRLQEMGRFLRDTFAENLAEGALVSVSATKDSDPIYSAENLVDGNTATYWMPEKGTESAMIELDLRKSKRFDTIVLQEYIPKGQRIEAFHVDIWEEEGWMELARSTTIGYKRILRFAPVSTQKLRINITESRICPTLSKIGIYLGPDSPTLEKK